MARYIYDVETNGLLKTMDRIHCLVMRDVDTRETFRFRRVDAEYPAVIDKEHTEPGRLLYKATPAQDNIAEGIRMLEEADELIGHNIIHFDEKAIRLVFPDYSPKGKITDTLVLSRMIIPDTKAGDAMLSKRGKFPGYLVGSHSLDAWGHRLGKNKGDYQKVMIGKGLDPWASWNPYMEAYCLAPSHKLLGPDLRWKKASEFSVGDVVLGFDENGSRRRWRSAEIESIRYEDAPVFDVELENGDVITTTAEHRWLVKKTNSHNETLRYNWVETKDLVPGVSSIPQMLKVWDEHTSKDAGWLTGIFDGEGAVSSNCRQLTVSQNPGPVLDRIDTALEKYGTVNTARVVKANSKCEVRYVGDTLAERLRFLGTVRPERLIAKIDFDKIGCMQARYGCHKVVSVRPAGVQQIIKIQTSSRTFIAEGYPMHNCENDIDVNEILYHAITQEMPPDSATDLEHQIHEIVGVMERNGYFFDAAQAETLTQSLEEKRDQYVVDVKAKFGSWFRPVRKKIVKAQWDDPNGVNAAKTYEEPDTEWGEDHSRAVWGRMVFPKVTYRNHKKLSDRTEGCPFVPIERVDFNPGSRPQIIDRFTTVYDWVPHEFTDAGNPQVDDAVLNKLTKRIPEANDLSEILFYNKLIGQVATGKESWLNNYKKDDDGRIHPYTNVGGTVSNRCSHSGPNIGQVPSIKDAKIDTEGRVWDGDTQLLITPDEYVRVSAKKVLLKGRHGDYGYECRDLFFTPETINDEPWMQVGVDLSGIEFRMLAEVCAEFDGGELINVVLSGDIHQINMDSTGITERAIVKRVLYGLMYGAGMWKIGHTIDPYATDAAKKALGATIHAKLMKGLPALAKAIKKTQAEAERGYLIALDGRKLTARSTHSALNLRLQGNAATVAKKWVCLTEDMLFEQGLNHGWNGDFVFYAFVHDEIAAGTKKDLVDLYKTTCVDAARKAGEFFNLKCPIDAEAKVGHSWASTH